MSYVPAAPWEPHTKLSSDRKVALTRERYRAKHPPALRNEIGLPQGSVICFIYECILTGGTASEITERVIEKFNSPIPREKMRGNVLKYISDLRVKHQQNIITSTRWGENPKYTLEAQ